MQLDQLPLADERCSIAMSRVLELGKISKEQLAGQYPVWQTSLVNPDFTAYARLCGATGIPVHRADELDDAMKELFAADGPALLHVHADAELV